MYAAVLPLVLALADPPHPADDHLLVAPDGLKWVDGPPSLPKGAKMAVLEGDPTKDGPFVMRAKLPDGFRVMPHTHPKDERVTVLAGTLHMGVGKTFTKVGAAAMPAGAYGRMGAGVPHFAWAEGETVLQLHGVGPWAVDYLDPADDPRKKK